MAKRHIMIDYMQPPTPKQSKPPSTTNWELCILCQVKADEPLQCPLRSTKSSHGSGYVSLTENLHLFQGLQHMPMELNLERLDKGDGIEATQEHMVLNGTRNADSDSRKRCLTSIAEQKKRKYSRVKHLSTHGQPRSVQSPRNQFVTSSISQPAL